MVLPKKSSYAFLRVIYPPNKVSNKSDNVESNQKFYLINTELLGTKNESKKSENSTEQDGMNEYIEGGETSKDIKEIKKNDAIASASLKPNDGSKPDKVSDDKEGTNTVETSKKANKETKSSEDKPEGDFDKDALKTGPETPGEIKDKEVGKHKPENSPGQDEKKKSIEGKEEIEWLDHSEVQSQKQASLGKGLLLCDYQVDMFSSVLMITSLLEVVHRLDAS